MPLQGKGTEKGTYECQWNNSKGEARHRNFTVFPTFFVETTDVNINTNVIIITVTLIGLVLVAGTGFGIKFYLDKVRKLIDALNSTQINSLPFICLKEKSGKGTGSNSEWRPEQNRPRCANGISNGIPALRQEMGISKEKTQTRFVKFIFNVR